MWAITLADILSIKVGAAYWPRQLSTDHGFLHGLAIELIRKTSQNTCHPCMLLAEINHLQVDSRLKISGMTAITVSIYLGCLIYKLTLQPIINTNKVTRTYKK